MESLEDYLFKETAIVIHHGGEARKLSHLTKQKFPKGMLELGTKPRPLFDWVLAKYVDIGIKKFYITLWFNPKAVKKRCKEIEKYAGIKFIFIEEPKNKRLGRGGSIRFGIENRIIKEKNILSANGSDIINYDIKEFAQFHYSGLEKGYCATILGSPYDQSKGGRIFCNEHNVVTRFEEKPIIRLRSGEFLNTAVFYLDKNALKYLFEVNTFPFDLESREFMSQLEKSGEMRCYSPKNEIKLGENWIWVKDGKDYDTWKNLDLERFLGIKNIEELLGPYSSKN
ncbi:MAG: NDP-sugar synthase [Candidatus Aenigmatarchaeota archaeon]